MIISASRRTDIPAFYGQWFCNRLKAGFVMVRNPMNPNMVSKIILDPQMIDCIVFWTKNPRPLFPYLDELADIPYIFLFTLTPYSENIECNLPPKPELLDTFIHLAGLLGKERVIWRYDPILFSDALRIDESYHILQFEAMARKLKNHTKRCITSFLDMYKKCERNLHGLHIKIFEKERMTQVIGRLNQIAEKYGIQLTTCAESIDFSSVNVTNASCIDEQIISQVCGYPLTVSQDRNQRKHCLCVESIDIGAYNSCLHNCLYCYANADYHTVQSNVPDHYPTSPLLLGQISGSEIIKEKKVYSLKRKQGRLF